MHGRFQIGEYLIEPRLNRITSGKHPIQVAPKYMHVLVCLADAAGDVVTRADLMEAVWRETVVGDESLTRAISELRQVFGDEAQAPEYIETIRGRGYRLLPAVTYVPLPDRAATSVFTPATDRAEERRPWHTALRWGGVVLAISFIVGAMLWRQVGLGVENLATVSAYQARPLTSFPGLEVDPSLSPDGRHVAFAWGEDEDNLDVYVKATDTATLIRLTDTPINERKPTWSPDGRTLAFIRTGAGCAVVLVPAHGGAEQTLAACTAGTMPALSWSPDGETLVWAERLENEAPFHLTAFNLADRTQTRLTDPSSVSTGDGYPAFSPDGQTLAFVRTQAFGIQDIYMYDRATESITRLTHDETKIGGLTWTPDGEGLLISSKRSGAYGLWYLPLAGGSLQWANAIHENVHHPSMAHQGPQRAYERRMVDTNIWCFQLSGNSGQRAVVAQPWITSTRWEGYPAWSPDGLQVAFASDRSGSPEIWIAQQDGSGVRKLTNIGGPFVAHPQWSMDGTTIAFEARAEGNADIYLFHLDTGVQERLTSNPANDIAPRWSRDGQALYFGSNRQDGWQLWKQSMADGTLHQITQEGGYVGMEAVDGEILYYVKHDVPGLWSQPLAGGASTLILDAVSPSYGNSWVLTRQGVFFIQQAKGAAAQLTHYDFSTRQPTALPLPSNPLVASGLTLSPTSDKLCYVQVDHNESDLIIEEPFTHK